MKVIVGVTSQLSLLVAVPVLAGSVLAVQAIVMAGGQVRVGTVLSSTVMTCIQVVILPQSSNAFQVRLMVLSCGHVPAMVTSVNVGTTDRSQLSVAVAEPVIDGVVADVHCTVILTGHEILGAVKSYRVISWIQVAVL